MSDDTKKFELSPAAAIVLAGVLIAGAIIFVNNHPAPTPAGQPTVAGAQQAPANLNIRKPSSSDHIIGSPDAPIVLVEYSDFQCPFCSLIYPTLKKIVSDSNGQIAWVYRNFPLSSIHPQATPAANAAECIAAEVGNDAFWKFADDIFADQGNMSSSYYAQLAQQLGAPPAAFAACMSAKTYQSKIDTDTTEAEQNGGTGTPFTVVVNTKTGKMAPISGALPEAQIVSVINSVK